MGYNSYHWCVVPNCKNTSIKTPEKLFIKMPADIKMRNVWLQLAKRDPQSLSTKSVAYFCEDHFDLENDMENFMRYKIMGSVKKILMKANCKPSRFNCHTDKKHKLTPNEPHSPSNKKQLSIKESEHMLKDMECESVLCKPDLPNIENVLETEIDNSKADKGVQVEIDLNKEHKAVQASTQYRSKSVQTSQKMKKIASSRFKLVVSTATSPIREIIPVDKPPTLYTSSSRSSSTCDSSLHFKTKKDVKEGLDETLNVQIKNEGIEEPTAYLHNTITEICIKEEVLTN